MLQRRKGDYNNKRFPDSVTAAEWPGLPNRVKQNWCSSTISTLQSMISTLQQNCQVALLCKQHKHCQVNQTFQSWSSNLICLCRRKPSEDKDKEKRTIHSFHSNIVCEHAPSQCSIQYIFEFPSILQLSYISNSSSLDFVRI